MNINEVISEKSYDFLRDNHYLKGNMLFVTFGGSHAYGLSGPTSDIDIRGVCLNSKDDLLGCGFLDVNKDKNVVYDRYGFEQYNDVDTDTVIYSFNKFVKLIYNCNPNTIEMLGCLPEHYSMLSEAGKYLIDNYEVFLSKKAYHSFAGYARGQFQRLKNALGKDSFGEFSRTVSLADSLLRLNKHLEEAYPGYNRDMLGVLITDMNGDPVIVNGVKAVSGDVKLIFNNNITVADIRGKSIDPEKIQLRFNLNIENLTSSEFSSVTNEINTNLKEFTKTIGHRNNKKDNYHLCKHAMHLIRLYLMGYDILKNKKIVTYREKDHDFLMSIKNGEYFNGKTFTEDFFDMVNSYDVYLSDAFESSTLPDSPIEQDVKRVIKTVNRW